MKDAVPVVAPAEIVISENNEYIIAQLTIRTDKIENVIVNVQGKELNKQNPWSESNIVFNLKPHANPNSIPPSCTLWYDGCNVCNVNNGILGGCTRVMCFTEDEPECRSYSSGH